MRTPLIALSIFWAGSALAMPNLKPQQIEGVTVAVPVGWAVQFSKTPVPTIRLEAPPGAADSPSIFLMSVPLKPGGPSVADFAGQLVQTTMVPAKLIGQQAAPNGAMMTLWQGPIGQIPAKMAVMYQADSSSGLVAAFAAPIAKFDRLGGAGLLVAVLSGQAASAPAKRVAGGRALNIPAAYRGSNTPILDYFADNFEKLSPGQIATGLRQMNRTEYQLLGVYGSFANLLHFVGCRADASLRLATGANCAQTRSSWAQTLQFTNNDMGQATMQAQNERAQIQIAARCGDGRNAASTCTMYRKTQSEMSRSHHKGMMRIIAGMADGGCLIGDPGCVAY